MLSVEFHKRTFNKKNSRATNTNLRIAFTSSIAACLPASALTLLKATVCSLWFGGLQAKVKAA